MPTEDYAALAATIAPRYTDVMLDLETLGTAPGSAIISIGAVVFAEGKPEREWTAFHVEAVSWTSCRAVGLVQDEDTMRWWSEQSAEARAVFERAMRSAPGDTTHIVTALQNFAAWIPPGARLWSNGANFDGVLLREACRRAAVEAPWKYYDEQCFRTIKKEWAAVSAPAFQGVKHSALDDARHQARHLQAIWAHVANLRAANYVYVGPFTGEAPGAPAR